MASQSRFWCDEGKPDESLKWEGKKWDNWKRTGQGRGPGLQLDWCTTQNDRQIDVGVNMI